jgi:DNA-binding CsgD family transcriptional regulator
MAELSPSPGSLRTDDTRVESLMEGLRRRMSGVGSTADLLGPGGLTIDELRESPMFRDVAFPLGLPGSTLLLHSGASGEFLVHASYPEIERRPFGENTQQVLAPLLPAFAASIGALARLGNARQAIAVLLDALEDGAVVFDSDGHRVLARNAALSALVRKEPDRAGLERGILQAALAAAWPTNGSAPRSRVQDPGALSGGWQSPTGVPYRLRSVRLPPGSVARNEAILVLIQRVGPVVPEAAELMRRFGFTRREADVAQRLAYGRSDREIATDLGLSPHTVRHHGEAVFLKAGVTTRKALAVHLGSTT